MRKILFYLKYFIRRFFALILSDVNKINWYEKNIMPEQISYTLTINNIYSQIVNVPGHIIELGAGKGRNSIIFGTLIERYGETLHRHYFGFDTFSGYMNDQIKDKPHLKKIDLNYNQNLYLNLKELLYKKGLDKNVTLIKGDINKTLPKLIATGYEGYFIPDKIVISLIYIDCNVYEVTINSLNILKKYLAENAIIVIDECYQGEETEAVLQFAKENNQKVLNGNFGYNSHISKFIKWNKNL